MFRIAVLVSGSGTNFQAILDAIENGTLSEIEVGLVIADRASATALERAEKKGIPNQIILKNEPEKLEKALQDARIGGIVLAGYLSILPPSIVEQYPNRILNIHPSLIPAFCGKGFYGLKVHEAVLKSGITKTGATVHLVDTGIDTGKILIQEEVEVLPTDTPEILQQRVLKVEHKILVEAVAQLAAEVKNGESI